jgi:hypothetical protein
MALVTVVSEALSEVPGWLHLVSRDYAVPNTCAKHMFERVLPFFEHTC